MFGCFLLNNARTGLAEIHNVDPELRCIEFL